MVLTVDGKGVVLHHEDRREAARKAAERRRQQRETLSPFKRPQLGGVKTFGPEAARSTGAASALVRCGPWDTVC